MTQKHDNLIGGEWTAGTGCTPNVKLSDLSDVIGGHTRAEPLDAAVQAARAAFPAWSVSRAGNIFKFFAGLKYATYFKRHSQVGMVMANRPTAGVDRHVPFGGRKGSRCGPREQGRCAQEFHTVVKTAYTLA